MTISVIPLQPVPNQVLQVQLSGQAVELHVYQSTFAMFVDVYSGVNLVKGGQIAQNLNRIVRQAYHGFSGDMVFLDTQGNQDPLYWGLGDRWQLLYADDGFVPNLNNT